MAKNLALHWEYWKEDINLEGINLEFTKTETISTYSQYLKNSNWTIKKIQSINKVCSVAMVMKQNLKYIKKYVLKLY